MSIRTFEGAMVEARHPIDPEHYTTVAKATAEALAEELVRRVNANSRQECPFMLRDLAATLLTEWFTGKFTPPQTDPPDGAPDQSLNTPPPLPRESEQLRAVKIERLATALTHALYKSKLHVGGRPVRDLIYPAELMNLAQSMAEWLRTNKD